MWNINIYDAHKKWHIASHSYYFRWKSVWFTSTHALLYNNTLWVLKFITHYFSSESSDVQPGPWMSNQGPSIRRCIRNSVTSPHCPALIALHLTRDAINIYIITTLHEYIDGVSEKFLFISRRDLWIRLKRKTRSEFANSFNTKVYSGTNDCGTSVTYSREWCIKNIADWGPPHVCGEIEDPRDDERRFHFSPNGFSVSWIRDKPRVEIRILHLSLNIFRLTWRINEESRNVTLFQDIILLSSFDATELFNIWLS